MLRWFFWETKILVIETFDWVIAFINKTIDVAIPAPAVRFRRQSVRNTTWCPNTGENASNWILIAFYLVRPEGCVCVLIYYFLICKKQIELGHGENTRHTHCTSGFTRTRTNLKLLQQKWNWWLIAWVNSWWYFFRFSKLILQSICNLARNQMSAIFSWSKSWNQSKWRTKNSTTSANAFN